jgi:hypothetical protein
VEFCVSRVGRLTNPQLNGSRLRDLLLNQVNNATEPTNGDECYTPCSILSFIEGENMKTLTISTIALGLLAGVALSSGAIAAPVSPSPIVSSSNGAIVQAKMSNEKMMMMRKKKMMKTKKMKKGMM